MWAWLRKLVTVRPSLNAIARRRTIKRARRQRLGAAVHVLTAMNDRQAMRIQMLHVAIEALMHQAKKHAEEEFFATVGKKVKTDLERDFAKVVSKAMKPN